MSDSQTISFKCLGDPQFYLASDPRRQDDDDQVKFYTLDRLPGDRLIIRIKIGLIEFEFKIQFDERMREHFECLIDAQIMNDEMCVHVQNHYNKINIRTEDGYTYFEHSGKNVILISPSSSILKIPNECCINEFKRLVDG
jgi:hypothetical protein